MTDMTPTTFTRVPSRLVLAATTLAGAVATAEALRNLQLDTGTWTPSWWSAALGAVIGVVVLAWRRPAGPEQHRWLAWAGLAGAALVLLPALTRAPWILLIAIVWVGNKVTRGPQHFDLQPDWFTTAAVVACILAGAAVLTQVRLDRRLARRRCPRCGRTSPAAGPLQRRLLRVAAAVAILAPLPYAAIKLAWGLGWTGGLSDPSVFDDVSFWSPGFGDTVIMAALGVATAAAMGAPLRGRVARLGLGFVGTVGSIMLLPVGLMAAVWLALAALGIEEIHDEAIRDWVFVVVYATFLVWGVALSTLTATYLRGTRPPCADHTQLPLPVLLER